MSSLLRGENLNIGIGMEDPAHRGTSVPVDKWIPGRTPTGINVEVVKTLIKETKASGIATRGSEVVQRKASGPLEFNLRSESIGYLLKSLLGKYSNSAVGGSPSVKDHLFEILPSDPQFPLLTLTLAQLGHQEYTYPGALVKSLEIKTPVDDLVNATAEFIAMDEEEANESGESAYIPTWDDSDYLFRPYEVEIKIADDLAGLAAAPALMVKEFSLSMANNARAQQHIGSITPTDNIANLLEIGGEMVLDYLDETYHNIFRDGTYKAMQIKIMRADIDIDTIYHPTITIQLAKVSFESNKPDRPLDDIVRDSLGFMAHYSEDDNEAINIVVRNEVDSYDYDESPI